MNLSLRQVRYVCTVAECGSIQAAARMLHISASSILAAIEKAEFDIGARLFDRRRAEGTHLTAAGERFAAAGHALLAAESEFKRQISIVQSDAPQVLRIGCFEPFGPLFMTEGLKRFTSKFGPTEVALFEGDQTQLADWLNRGVVDLVVNYDIGPSFGASVTPICRVPAHALLCDDHPLAGKSQIAIAQLAEHPQVLLDLPQTSAYLLDLFEFGGVPPSVRFRTRSYENVRSAVAAGFGAAVLNLRPLDMFNADAPGLVRVALDDGLPAPILQIVDLYGTNKPPAVKGFIETVQSLFLERGAPAFAVASPARMETIFHV